MTDITDVVEILASNQKSIQEILCKQGAIIREQNKAIIETHQMLQRLVREDVAVLVEGIDDLG
jgi:hypothetical protein